MVPVPGNGQYEWKGFLPIKERPHVFNPSKGFFATANQHVTPKDYQHPSTLAYTWADDYRGDRVNEMLAKEEKSTIASSMALQTDYTSLPARALVPLLLQLRFTNAENEKLKELFTKWNYQLNKESIPAAIYVMWERTINTEAKNKFVPRDISSYITLQTSTIVDWMKNPEKIFGENGPIKRDVFLQVCFEKAIEQLKLKLGTDPQQWQYGQAKYKHISIKHPLSAWVNESKQSTIDFGPLPRGFIRSCGNITGIIGLIHFFLCNHPGSKIGGTMAFKCQFDHSFFSQQYPQEFFISPNLWISNFQVVQAAPFTYQVDIF
jgi:penicillin amidase